VWGVWHLPVALSDPELRPLVPFLLSFPSLAVIFTWVFIHTRQSLFIAVLLHAWYDVVLLYPVQMIPAAHFEVVIWALAAVQGLVATAIVVFGGLRPARIGAVNQPATPSPQPAAA
jgi:hypothetical protein